MADMLIVAGKLCLGARVRGVLTGRTTFSSSESAIVADSSSILAGCLSFFGVLFEGEGNLSDLSGDWVMVVQSVSIGSWIFAGVPGTAVFIGVVCEGGGVGSCSCTSCHSVSGDSVPGSGETDAGIISS